MEIQTTICLPPQQLAIIPFNQYILPQNTIQSPEPDDTYPNDLLSFRQKLFSDITEEFKTRYTIELLIASAYLWILKTTSSCHLALAFELLEEKTGLSDSISPVVTSFFKYSLAIFAGVSVAFTDVKCRPLRTSTILKRIGLFGTGLSIPLAHLFSLIKDEQQKIIFYISDVICLSFSGGFNGYGKYGWLLNFSLYMLTLTIISPIGVRTNMSTVSILVLTVIVSTSRAADELQIFTSSAPSLLCCIDESIRKMLPTVGTRLKSSLNERKKAWKFVKYALGLVGTLIFQNFFRLSTFRHVRAFMYLATSWLANIALINASNDYGILNFLLGNMILGSTVNQSGLGISTWISYCICIFLYVLGIKLKSMNIAQNFEKLPKPPIVFWIFYCVVSVDSLFLFHYY